MTVLIEYKKARLKFAPLETLSAGMELLGTEVKSLRARQGSLDGARVLVRGGEAYLVGATIPPFQAANAPKEYDPERPRRLLLAKNEIAVLADAEAKKGLTVIPLEIYFSPGSTGYIKVRVAIARGKQRADRREDLKRREADRERARALKTH